MKPIRILYVCGGIMQRGGIESYMMNYYRHINKNNIQIDFIVHGFEKGIYDDEIKSMGGKIFNIPIKSKNILGNIKAMKKVFNTGDYKIVHSHMDAMNTVVLKYAKKSGIPVRISHAHSTNHYTENKIKYFINELSKKKSTKYATDLWACSLKSGKWLYGEQNVDKIKLIPNAININDFHYDENIRKQMRKEFGIQKELVIGHVGNFNNIKNHGYLIEVFKKVHLSLPNSKLLLVGDGENKKYIKKLVADYKLDRAVTFLNIRNDVHKVMQAFDIFVLPSKFEGFPVVAIEAQCADLNCIFSDTITKEISIVKEKNQFLSIENSEEVWTNAIIKSLNSKKIKKNEKEKIWKKYDIKNQANILENMYMLKAKEEKL